MINLFILVVNKIIDDYFLTDIEIGLDLCQSWINDNNLIISDKYYPGC
jgi:hypothetical protein